MMDKVFFRFFRGDIEFLNNLVLDLRPFAVPSSRSQMRAAVSFSV